MLPLRQKTGSRIAEEGDVVVSGDKRNISDNKKKSYVMTVKKMLKQTKISFYTTEEFDIKTERSRSSNLFY